MTAERLTGGSKDEQENEQENEQANEQGRTSEVVISGCPSVAWPEKKASGSSATATGSANVSKKSLSHAAHCGTLSASREFWNRAKNCTPAACHSLGVPVSFSLVPEPGTGISRKNC